MSEKYISKGLRKKVIKRAKHICEYCLAIRSFSFHTFTIDHILPTSLGGNNDYDNLAYACQNCNSRKYNKCEGLDPFTSLKAPLYNPRLHNREDHFVWNKDFTIMIGISPIGRATVHILKINRQEAVNLRAILHSFGIHPIS